MRDVLLNYSRPARRIRWRWPILGLVVALAVFVVGRKLDPILRWRIPYLLAQHRCMNFSPPPDQVAYQEDAQQAPPLAGGNNGGLAWTVVTDPVRNRRTFYLTPNVLRDSSRDGETNFQRESRTGCCLFLHARRAKGGEERQVYVELNYLFADRNKNAKIGFNFPYAFDWEVIQPGSLSSHPRKLASGSWGDATFHIQMRRPLCIYCGQPDPADPSHFTFKFTLPRRTGIIDAWLQPDNQLRFSVR